MTLFGRDHAGQAHDFGSHPLAGRGNPL